MSLTKSYQHWRLETDIHQLVWLYFDKANASVNTIDPAVMEEFSEIIDSLSKDTNCKGIIIASGKDTGFIAGADISLFNKFKDIDHATSVLLQGQQILEKLERLSIPVVAMIDGFCLGGGLELALACHYRVAVESPKTRLGLPEVKLGIHPGWGGTVRLPRLIGAKEGLNLILGGHTVSAKAAAKLGFVDAAVPKRQLKHAALYYALNKPPRHEPGFLAQVLNHQLVRPVFAHFIRKQMRKKANPLHYPASYQALDNWEVTGVNSAVAYEREAKSCGRLFFSETSQNLVRVFFLQEKLKNIPKDKAFKPQHVHVIGAGTMGGDIAAWCALQGMTVTLQDLEPKYIAPAIKRASKLYKEKLKERHLIEKALDRLIPDVDGNGIRNADVIIEAVIEDLAVKQATFKHVEQFAKPDAVLATNTSSILLDDINTVLKNPERLIGIHFFNPVAKMQLVEIVKGKKTSDAIINRVVSFVRMIDRLPLLVKSSPGFLVNRILMPYLLGAVELVNEGIPMSIIDKALVEFGMPMGPITLADTVGLDVCLSVANYLGRYYNTPIPKALVDMVNAKNLGRKTGQGFYQYDKSGKQIKSSMPVSYDKPLEEIANRLILTMLNETFACLREGVVTDADLLDAGMVYGTGFAPFRGGPMHYAKSQGIDELFQQFIKQQQARGQQVDANANWDVTTV